MLLLSSQTIARQTQERFKNFYVQDGLSQNSSMSLLQDSHGFLWIGTQAGLNRYNGYEFEAFTNIREDSTSLKDDYIRTIYEDSNQTLWVGTKSGGIHRFDEKTQAFERYDLVAMLGYSMIEEGATPNDVAKIVETAPHQYWLGTAAGLVFFDAQANQATLVEYGVPIVSRINELLINAEGDLWIGDEAGYVVRRTGLPPDAGSLESNEIMLIANVSINGMYADEDGNVLIGTFGKGMYRYEASVNQFEQPISHVDLDLPSDSITVIQADEEGRFWVGSLNEGLALIYDRNDIRHFMYDPSNSYSISDNQIADILIDRTGVVWIGTWDGLSRLSPVFEVFDLFTHSEEEGSLSSVRVVSFEEESPGYYWLGTFGGGLFRYDAIKSSFTQFKAQGAPGDVCGNNIIDLNIDEENLLWIASVDDGLCFLDLNTVTENPTSVRFTTFQNNPSNASSLRDNMLQSVFSGSDGAIWVGLYNQGLDRFDKATGTFEHFDDSPERGGLSSKQIWPIIEDQTGSLWIGAFEGGLIKYTPNSGDEFERFQLDEGQTSSNRIYDLHLDSHQNLWAATDDGAKKIELSTMEVTTLLPADGLVHENIRAIVEDDFGNIWLSSNFGLSMYSPERDAFTNFYIEDGLQDNRFYARSAMKMSDGTLFFGGSNGFNIIHPEKIIESPPEPQVLLNQVLVNNQILNNSEPSFLTDELELKHFENRLYLSFASLNYSNLGRDKYRYRLRSNSNLTRFNSTYLDTNWVETGTDNFVSFNALSSGNYLFEVVSKSRDGKWNPAGLSLPIKINPPWYARWWFRGLSLITIIGIVAGILLVRTRYLLNIQRMKADALLGIEKMRVKIAQGLHDDVGANMATIAMRLGMMSSSTGIDETDRRKLKDLSSMVRQTGQSIRETSWIINVKYDDLRNLVNQMRELAFVMLDGTASYSFQQDPNPMPEYQVEMEFKQNIYLLYKEALNNANKYSNASNIKIDVLLNNNQLSLSISDNGVGFRKEEIKEGSGLGNMASRAQEMNGHFSLESEPGKGTSIIIVAPIVRAEGRSEKIRTNSKAIPSEKKRNKMFFQNLLTKSLEMKKFMRMGRR